MSSLKDFCKNNSIKLELGKDLTNYSTLKLKAVGDLLTLKSIEEVQKTVIFLKSKSTDYQVLGWGANTLLKETSESIYLQLAFPFEKNYLSEVRDEYELPASIGLNRLTAHAIKFGLRGWEVFTGVPASLGGAVFMNAGTKLGEIGDIVKRVLIVTNYGKLREVVVNNESFSYRQNNFLKEDEIIVGLILGHMGIDKEVSIEIKNYIDLRNKTQPLTKRTCGCVFKNKALDKNGKLIPGCLAGQTIDKIGLKGFRYKNLQISPVHANFIENLGESTYTDFLEFVEIIKKKILDEAGMDFELEVRL